MITVSFGIKSLVWAFVISFAIIMGYFYTLKKNSRYT